jgi:hypothetical protein
LLTTLPAGYGVNSVWGVVANGEGFYFFKSSSKEFMRFVLDGGPWHVVNKLLVLKKWEPCMSLSQEELKKILVWMKFYDNIPNEYWHSLGCSYVANAIGRPMYSDVITSQ